MGKLAFRERGAARGQEMRNGGRGPASCVRSSAKILFAPAKKMMNMGARKRVSIMFLPPSNANRRSDRLLPIIKQKYTVC